MFRVSLFIEKSDLIKEVINNYGFDCQRQLIKIFGSGKENKVAGFVVFSH